MGAPIISIRHCFWQSRSWRPVDPIRRLGGLRWRSGTSTRLLLRMPDMARCRGWMRVPSATVGGRVRCTWMKCRWCWWVKTRRTNRGSRAWRSTARRLPFRRRRAIPRSVYMTTTAMPPECSTCCIAMPRQEMLYKAQQSPIRTIRTSIFCGRDSVNVNRGSTLPSGNIAHGLAMKDDDGARFELSRILAARGQFAEAETALNRAIRLSSQPLVLYMTKARFELASNQPRETLESLQPAERSSPFRHGDESVAPELYSE